MKVKIEKAEDSYFRLNVNLIIIIYFNIEKIVMIDKFEGSDKKDNGAISQIDIKVEILLDIQNDQDLIDHD